MNNSMQNNRTYDYKEKIINENKRKMAEMLSDNTPLSLQETSSDPASLSLVQPGVLDSFHYLKRPFLSK